MILTMSSKEFRVNVLDGRLIFCPLQDGSSFVLCKTSQSNRLTQSVLSAIPAYVMQGTMLLGKTLDTIDKISRNVIWGTIAEKRKLHTVSWEKVMRLKRGGGLDISTTKPKKLALLAKLNWRLHTEREQPWAKVLGSKYKNA